jgi:hypothetical protein
MSRPGDGNQPTMPRCFAAVAYCCVHFATVPTCATWEAMVPGPCKWFAPPGLDSAFKRPSVSM